MEQTTIKVLDIHCQITGTDDYSYSKDYPQCQQCSYSKSCQAKFDESMLEEAYQIYMEAIKTLEEAQNAVDFARARFQQEATDNDILKYQYKHLVVSRVYYAPSVTYPKKNLLKVFTKEQLEPAAEHKDGSWQTRITDLLKEKKKRDE